jgi:hypothetical protein
MTQGPPVAQNRILNDKPGDPGADPGSRPAGAAQPQITERAEYPRSG